MEWKRYLVKNMIGLDLFVIGLVGNDWKWNENNLFLILILNWIELKMKQNDWFGGYFWWYWLVQHKHKDKDKVCMFLVFSMFCMFFSFVLFLSCVCSFFVFENKTFFVLAQNVFESICCLFVFLFGFDLVLFAVFVSLLTK